MNRFATQWLKLLLGRSPELHYPQGSGLSTNRYRPEKKESSLRYLSFLRETKIDPFNHTIRKNSRGICGHSEAKIVCSASTFCFISFLPSPEKNLLLLEKALAKNKSIKPAAHGTIRRSASLFHSPIRNRRMEKTQSRIGFDPFPFVLFYICT